MRKYSDYTNEELVEMITNGEEAADRMGSCEDPTDWRRPMEKVRDLRFMETQTV